MKPAFIILLLWVSTTCSSWAAQEDVTVYGKIRGAKSGAVSLDLLQDFINFKEVSLEAELDTGGNFTLNVSLSAPCLAELNYNGETIRMYLQPNDNIELHTDANNFAKNILFQGNGAAENNYFVLFANELEQSPELRLIPSKVRDLAPNDYIGAVALKKTLLRTFLGKYMLAHAISPSFEALINNEIDYNAAYELLVYPEMHSYLTGENISMPANYFDFLKNTSVENPAALISYCYANFLEEYARYLFRESNISAGSTFKYAYLAMYDLLKQQFQNKQIKDFVLAQDLVNALENTELSLIEQPYQDYMASAPQAEYATLLQVTYNKHLKLSKGHKAPNFTLKNPIGKTVSLDDFKGKVVYLDFWASWCKPCLKEIEYANKLKEKFVNKDVVFLYVSLDENEQHWLRSIKARNIQGIHLNSKGIDSQVALSYDIQQVPSFFLIDKDGNLFDKQAKRPSNEALAEDMMMLLQR